MEGYSNYPTIENNFAKVIKIRGWPPTSRVSRCWDIRGQFNRLGMMLIGKICY